MIRKPLIIGLVAVAGMFAAGTAPVHAQKSVGEWMVYPTFNSQITKVVDTKDKVYYLSSGSLFSYDKDNNETYAYTAANRLNDNTNITGIHYNADGGYLAVVYKSAKIDLIYDNGKVVNLSDIADASMPIDKAVNDLAFNNGRIYAATNFGIVVFDDKKYNVIETGVFDANIDAICVVGNYLIIHNANTNRTENAPLDARHNSLDKFFLGGGGSLSSFIVLSPNCYIAYHIGSANLAVRTNDDRGNLTAVNHITGVTVTGTPFHTADGLICIPAGTELLFLNPDGTEASRQALPAELQGQQLSSATGSTANLWGGNEKGIANYSLGADGTLTVLSDKAVPQNTSTVRQVVYMQPAADGSRVYVSNLGVTLSRSSVGDVNNGHAVMQTTDYIENGKIYDAGALNVEHRKKDTKNLQAKSGTTRMFGGPQRFAVDPQNPRRYFMANWLEGVFVIEDQKVIAVFDKTNMPVWSLWAKNEANGANAFDVNFDPEGNLWVGNWESGCDLTKYAPYNVLPKSKLYGDLSQITKEDWLQTVTLNKDTGDKDMGSVFSKDGVMIYWDRRSDDYCCLHIINTKKTWTNMADDVFEEIYEFTDQDGKQVKPVIYNCGIEDAKGRIWMGTNMGIIEFPNPGNILNANYRVNRLKVPRNDGTIYADYLLESENVNDIAIDAANRKWVATENSGLYLVSENGDKILEHFTTANSPLPSDAVQSVLCDPKSNVVYIGTPVGLVSYNSTSSPAADDYSEAYAYPNPVRPDYTGWITVKGLMNNSLVKIADAAGNVFFQGRSDGGMIVWDGCNQAGERVRSGVYFVYASQNENGSSSGVVTKILVVN